MAREWKERKAEKKEKENCVEDANEEGISKEREERAMIKTTNL